MNLETDQPPAGRNRQAKKMIYLPLLVFGALIVLLSFYLCWKGGTATRWPAVEGTILESRVEVDPEGRSSFILRYRYQVGGESFESSQVSLKVKSETFEVHEQLVARFPANQRVAVYYNPQSPKEAVVDNSTNNAWVAFTVIGAFVLGLGLLVYFGIIG